MKPTLDIFGLEDRTAVVVGGAGALGSAMARALGTAGARVALCSHRPDAAGEIADRLQNEGIQASAYDIDAADRHSIQSCRDAILTDSQHIDILVNAAGGNDEQATTSPDLRFFDLPQPAMEHVLDLNVFAGAILPAQVFGERMVANPTGGSIIHISSMAALRPLTRVAGYSAAKAAVSNFTQWLAVHIAREYTPLLRVNAIAPGFFSTPQNRFLLIEEATGEWTDRGQAIVDHIPMGKFGDPRDLAGAAIWLASEASRYVTGTVIPVDGGFSAFSGV